MNIKETLKAQMRVMAILLLIIVFVQAIIQQQPAATMTISNLTDLINEKASSQNKTTFSTFGTLENASIFYNNNNNNNNNNTNTNLTRTSETMNNNSS